MIEDTGVLNQRFTQIDDYLGQIESCLKRSGIGGVSRSEILTELKSHLRDRAAEFQLNGALDPLGRAITALGDPQEIASEFIASNQLHAAGRSFFPPHLLWATWSVARKFGRGLRLFAIALLGYGLAISALVTALMKAVLPDRVGFWVGSHGVVWGIPPEGAIAREVAGNWFVPLTLWLALLAGVVTTLLLRKQMQTFAASLKWRRAV